MCPSSCAKLNRIRHAELILFVAVTELLNKNPDDIRTALLKMLAETISAHPEQVDKIVCGAVMAAPYFREDIVVQAVATSLVITDVPKFSQIMQGANDASFINVTSLIDIF